jgi:hypothetical protein
MTRLSPKPIKVEGKVNHVIYAGPVGPAPLMGSFFVGKHGFFIPNGTKIMKKGKQVGLGAIQNGIRVRLTYLIAVDIIHIKKIVIL